MILRTVSKNRLLRKKLIRLFISLYDFSARMINSLVILDNGGIHPKHELIGYHDFFTTHVNQSWSVIDIGCGMGAVAADLAKKVKRVVAVDIDPKNIALAKQMNSAPNIEYLVADATVYPWKEHFDAVVLSNVLEHIEDRVTFLKKILSLAPILLLRVPMINRDWLTLYKRQLGLFHYADSTHYTEYTVESFASELQTAGLIVKTYSVQFGELWAVVTTPSRSFN